jgi:hypothetical protein
MLHQRPVDQQGGGPSPADLADLVSVLIRQIEELPHRFQHHYGGDDDRLGKKVEPPSQLAVVRTLLSTSG